jgi:glucan exporter ATP-binding protein
MHRFLTVYGRALSFLRPHRSVVALLCVANLALATISFIEPVLFGRIVAGLNLGGPGADNILLWAGLGVLGIAAGMGTSLLADRMAQRLRLHVAGQAYSHVLQLPPAYHAKYPTGSLIKILWTGTDELFGLWLNLFREHLGMALVLAGLLPVAFAINPMLAGVLCVLAVVFGITVWLTMQRTQSGQRRAESAHTVLSTRVGDVIGNTALIRAFGAAPDETASFGRLAGDVLRHQFPVLGWWAGVTVMSRAASTLATVTIVVLGAWLHGKGKASTADVVTFMGFSGMLIGRLEGAVWTVSRLGATLVRLQDFFAMMDAGSTVPDPPGRPALPPGPGAVEFRGVRFGYPGGTPVLDGLDFVAAPGETVALVGETGSGKSTAMSLLQRLWDVTEGQILVDGHDIREVSLVSLRHRIGTVPQESLLLNRTIGENLRLGKPDATQAEVEHAARLAEAHSFIIRQPAGYDTVVGERGAALSGGQRQRLAIARALLRDPSILVLDEATSALDGATEEKVTRAMQAAAVGRTTFVIAHRLATIRNADRILFFREGRVAESGSFQELIALNGAFAALARMQLLAGPAEPGAPHSMPSRPEPQDRAEQALPQESAV